jgi:hypothetical protein
MANIPLTMQQIRAIIQLLEKRFSYRSISRELKIHRKPITDYDKLFIASGLSYSSLRQLSDELQSWYENHTGHLPNTELKTRLQGD